MAEPYPKKKWQGREVLKGYLKTNQVAEGECEDQD
jgi:hypothetical protein